MTGDRPGRVTGARRRLPWQTLAAFAVAQILSGVAGESAAAQGFPLRIDCPDAPLYAVGGLTLQRNIDSQGLVLEARVRHNRTAEAYGIVCTTEAAAAIDRAEGGQGRSTYLFVCTARADGRNSGGASAGREGSVPGGLGLDHPETQSSIAAAVCPAARHALSRYRAGIAN